MPKVVKLLDIQTFDNGQHRPPFPVPVGVTVIGRGDFLKCKSTEVSRSHARLEADSNGNLTLTADNKKPCYYKLGGESDKQVLKQNESVQLHHGDVFSLTASSSGYEVQVSTDDTQRVAAEGEICVSLITSNASTHGDATQNIEATIQPKNKRKFPDWMSESDEEEPNITRKKAIKDTETESSRDVNNVDLPGTSEENTETIDKLDHVSQETNIIDDQESDVQPPVDADIDSGSRLSKEGDKESENSNDTFFEPDEEEAKTTAEGDPSGSSVNTNNPSTSATTPQRPTCKYAEKCYRKNPQHKADFCHPDDPDYTTTTTTTTTPKPRCQYGTSCYRVNPQHKQDFDHTQPPLTPPQSPKKKKKPRDAAQKKKTVDWDSGSEESYDESFIDDNSSDDYHPDDETESDGDWD